jgi:predicted DNA-binding transcriptional regulator AlpA
VRAKVPGKLKLSYSRVAWYRRDVEAWIESLKKAG